MDGRHLGVRGKIMKERKQNSQGFTLVELLIAMVIAMIVLGAIFFTFKSQQDSYLVQSQVSMAQQNVRAAMYMIGRDIQMAGYYTEFVTDSYTMDWDDQGGNETIRPLIYARDNIDDSGGGDGIKDRTDLIVIVNANMDDGGQLGSGQTASGTTASESLRGVTNLEAERCGLLVKEDLLGAEFFQVDPSDAGSGAIQLSATLNESYYEGDWIYRADVIVYYVDDTTDPQHPSLIRHNLGKNESPQTIAEDIEDLQFRYLLDDGTLVSSGFDEENVRAVEVSLLTRTRSIIRGYTDPNTYNIGDSPVTPGGQYRRKLLKALIKTRNIGL